jgi:hypothetical protein
LNDCFRRNSAARKDEDGVIVLKHGRTARTIKANVGKNIATEVRARVKPKQAIAIAFSRPTRRSKGSHQDPQRHQNQVLNAGHLTSICNVRDEKTCLPLSTHFRKDCR